MWEIGWEREKKIIEWERGTIGIRVIVKIQNQSIVDWFSEIVWNAFCHRSSDTFKYIAPIIILLLFIT